MFQLFSNLKNMLGLETKTSYKMSVNSFIKMANAFGISSIESDTMIKAIEMWNSVFQRSKTQIMKTVCHEAAKLTLTDMDITVSSRNTISEAEKAVLNTAVSDLKNKLTRKLELGIALGGLIIKPTTKGFDIIAPTDFIPVSFNASGELCSVIFIDKMKKNGVFYTKLEYHHFEGEKYVIDNKVFCSKNEYELGDVCKPKNTEAWADLESHVEILNLAKPLYSYFRMPGCNNVDETSEQGISLCSSAIEYIHSFDNAFDGFRADLETTRKVIFVNNSSMLSLDKSIAGKQRDFTHNPLPNLIVGMNGGVDQIKEFNPSCNVNEFKTALQMLLDIIATSSGFTTGYFTFDNRRAAVTATQIESEDQNTIATISSIRENLKVAITDAVIAFIDTLYLYNMLQKDDYDVTFYARDLSVTPEADRQHTLALVKEGYYPLELYLKEYEGFSDEDIEKYRNKIPAFKTTNE